MRIKEALKFEKENMPDFQWQYEKFLFVFLLIWLGGAILALAVGLIIGFIFDGSIYALIPIMVWGSFLAVTLIVFVKKTKTVKAKLLTYHKENLLCEFYATDYSEAKQNLIKNGKITEEGFIVDTDETFEDFKNTVIPFEQVEIFLALVFGAENFSCK